jgi:hypothetical protein
MCLSLMLVASTTTPLKQVIGLLRGAGGTRLIAEPCAIGCLSWSCYRSFLEPVSSGSRLWSGGCGGTSDAEKPCTRTPVATYGRIGLSS